MYDKPDITLIYTHAKCYSGHNHLYIVVHPVSLDLLPLAILHLGMIEVTFDVVVAFQTLGYSLAIFPCDTVNDTTLVFESSFQKLRDILVNVFDSFLVSYLID